MAVSVPELSEERGEKKIPCTLLLNHYLQKNVRRREVLLSRVSVYIVVLMVSCHTVRIIPNIWEILQTLNMDDEADVVASVVKRISDHQVFVELLLATMGGPGDHLLPPVPHHLLLLILLHLLLQVWG